MRSRKRPADYQMMRVMILLIPVLVLLTVVLRITQAVRERPEPSEETEVPVEIQAEKKETETPETAETEIISASELHTVPAEEETEETETETVTPYLADLSDYRTGDIVDGEKIDKSDLSRYFTIHMIEEGDEIYNRISGRSYRKNDYVAISDLRYLRIPHYNYDGQIQMGELIVNGAIAETVVQIFTELFEGQYQIEKMVLVDNYWTGDPDSTDTASIDVNNTSAFNYRAATGSSNLSRHAYGMAIDINPQQNPYVSYSSGSPKWSHENANAYIDRDTGLPHVITHNDPAYIIFTGYGFTWGGDWNDPKDYQHFEIRY